jgi:hypothetical protein
MSVTWNNNDESIELWGKSGVWKDEGSPLSYTLWYCAEAEVWHALFEGAELGFGTLEECIALCRQHEAEGKATAMEHTGSLLCGLIQPRVDD